MDGYDSVDDDLESTKDNDFEFGLSGDLVRDHEDEGFHRDLRMHCDRYSAAAIASVVVCYSRIDDAHSLNYCRHSLRGILAVSDYMSLGMCINHIVTKHSMKPVVAYALEELQSVYRFTWKPP